MALTANATLSKNDWGVKKTTQEEVAMKKVGIRYEKEGFPTTAVREIRALRKLHHENVVRLLDVHTDTSGTGVGDSYLIFEQPVPTAEQQRRRGGLKIEGLKRIEKD
ncbi:Cyclin-dependent kinase 12 (Cell division cycle 2-related protein kinase 7) (Cell division protein kinase 12) [Durusdinium trenchii]|uniref:Cyclin-dependent kinase 12 (Cell division cycle 2-related protein kinase 7) (Cell division protein kinase 12) n=1 Tax=Durusdinium trenchii TaxID=1381693 RepID=A0ABP0LGM9_9DINO